MSDRVSDDDFSDIHAQVRRFVRHDVVPRENEIMAADRIPDDLRAAAAQMGLFGYAIPAEWGGLGLDLRQDVELAMEFGYTTLALRSMFGTNNGIAGQVLVNFGTEVQKKQWLERIASGDVVASFALTEPGAGSNPPACAPGRVVTAATGSSTGRSDSSPTPRSRTCSWYSPVLANRAPAAPASPCSSYPPVRPASASVRRTRKWARREPGPPTSSSTRSGWENPRSSAGPRKSVTGRP